MEVLVLLVVITFFAFAIAYFFGLKRQIGYRWSLFLSITLGPLIGLIIVMLSKKCYEEYPLPSNRKVIFVWILIALGVLIMVVRTIMIIKGIQFRSSRNFKELFASIGIIGLGYYLIEIGKGKSFNSEGLPKKDF